MALRAWTAARMAAIAALVACAPTGSASASTVSVVPNSYGQGLITYTAAPGEGNHVAVLELAPASVYRGGSWLVTDLGAEIEPGPWCERVDQHAARCTHQTLPGLFSVPVLGYRISLGDGDDTLEVDDTEATSDPPLRVFADGGPGNDVLHGSDRAPGGYGDPDAGPAYRATGDILRGAGGADRLYGMRGPDLLSDGEQAADARPDVFDGGAGADAVSYASRRAPVTVDLQHPHHSGQPGERDAAVSVEDVIGGRGADTLSGDDHGNWLDGGRGRDRLDGRRGDDHFAHGGGRIECGDGRDRVLTEDGVFAGLLTPRCERLATPFSGDLALRPFPRWVGAAVAYPVTCAVGDAEEGDLVPCSGSLRLWEAGGSRRLIARRSFGEQVRDRELVPARLTSLGRALAARPGGVRVIVELAVHNVFGRSNSTEHSLRWSIRLRRPR